MMMKYKEVIENKAKDRGVLIDPTLKRSSVLKDFKIWSKDPYTANCIHCHGVVDDENRTNVSIGKNSKFIINQSYLFRQLYIIYI